MGSNSNGCSSSSSSQVEQHPQKKKMNLQLCLLSAGEKKINVIKEVRAATSLGSKRSKRS